MKTQFKNRRDSNGFRFLPRHYLYAQLTPCPFSVVLKKSQFKLTEIYLMSHTALFFNYIIDSYMYSLKGSSEIKDSSLQIQLQTFHFLSKIEKSNIRVRVQLLK